MMPGGQDGSLSPYRRVSAETLRLATEATGAPEYLRGLARAVREGRASWAQITEGMADDLPEVRAVDAVVAARVQELAERASADEVAAEPDPEQPDRDDDEQQHDTIFRDW